MSHHDVVIAALKLPTDTSTWTEEQIQAYHREHLKAALDMQIPRHRRNAIVCMSSDRIRKPEVLSEEVLRKRVEDEINGVDPKAKKNARITQKGGLEILTKLLDRAEEVSQQPFAFSVGAIILFGSWDRNDKSHAGDIDIAVGVIPKEPIGSQAMQHLMVQRRETTMPSNAPEAVYYTWPWLEVFRFLQRRSRGLSLVDLGQISKSMPPGDKPFSYTILRGDAAVIASNFEHSEYGLKACRIRQRDPKTGKITTLFDDGTL